MEQNFGKDKPNQIQHKATVASLFRTATLTDISGPVDPVPVCRAGDAD
jgi:hypothetical protein